MPDHNQAPGIFLQAASQGAKELPPLLRSATRSSAVEVDPLLTELTVEHAYALGATARDGTQGQPETVRASGTRVLALEAEDGTTLFIHADKLAADIARLQPAAIVDGNVDLALFRDPDAASRGLADVIWKAVSVLRLPADGLAEEAMELARKWAIDQATDQLGDLSADRLAGKAWDTAAFLGAKALMWQIESKLAGNSGLYCWQDKTIATSDRCLPSDARLEKAAAGQPMLLLIHGTGSYTVGGFADLRADEPTWKALQARFPGGIFGFEHRSFSQSPQENALEILQALPPGARVAIVTHSRGGLVGDLLCLGQVDQQAIDAYRINLADCSDGEGLEREAAEERKRLQQIVALIGERRISVERYVRIACPARGTRFLSDNLEVALSDFLNVLQWGGGALVGAVAAAVGGPVAGRTFGKGASSAIGVIKRLLLEIAGRRIDPRMIPGIAAMRIDSPLAAFLAHPGTRRRDGVHMAVVAGDTEFRGFGLSNLGRRVANLFCDWRLFDDHDNDLVVDTDSMYAGLGFRAGARYLYDQGESVSHFRYFGNPLTRDALRSWLVADKPNEVAQFRPLTDGSKEAWKTADERRTRGSAGPRPVLIFLPGIMGSHISVRDKKPGDIDRIWFNFFRLGFGQLERIADIDDQNVFAEDLWERFYGDLAEYLGDSHTVIRCPYDWRQPIEACAEVLKNRIDEALRDHPGQPIRLLAHSMGGLVARAMMQLYPDTWKAVLASDGRLLMLGTPNNGAQLMVHTLLGKTSSMRGLEKLDGKHGLQEVLDIVAGFPGALSLLPRPGSVDAGGGSGEYYDPATWTTLKARNADRWYGDRIAATPAEALLTKARSFWTSTLSENKVPDPERVSYVFGQGEKTPCGVVTTADGRLQLLFTNEGDGSVTWQSGRIDNLPEDQRCWYLPAEHSDLTGEKDHFAAILELVSSGSTGKLERLPRSRGAAAQTFVLEAPPPVIPGEDELARAIFGSGPRRRALARGNKATLAVSVLGGDLRFIDQPVICGHFIGDPIAAAEAILDGELDGRLSERERLGVYAGPIGTSAVVLPPRSKGQSERESRPGAIIVGLGDFNGQLGSRQITETVRAAVLRLLLLLRDTQALGADKPVHIYSLLLGCNSTAHIRVAESVAAVTCGVLEANRQFDEALTGSRDRGQQVSSLTFIDIYRDVAITAAHAVADLRRSLANQLQGLDATIDPAPTLQIGKGVRERLSVDDGQGYWPRLIVTDADAPDIACPPECYQERCLSPIPPEVRQRLLARTASVEEVKGLVEKASEPKAQRHLPERLKYVFLSQRARAETLEQKGQPGLIEAIIKRQRNTSSFNPKLASTLFHLMIPVDYKAVAREKSRLLLVLDSYTATLPWELLQADDQPLATRTPMIRQLITARFRGQVPTANTNSACIIVSPSTSGYNKRFGGSAEKLADLDGAIAEGDAIRSALLDARWDAGKIVFCADGREAIDVLFDLYARPYRLLAVCGHGIFEEKALDGRSYSGVVLSDGLLITAVEIGLMEVVPEVVFLSCCHLGGMSHNAEPNRLAYSLARELIDIGVRCVVAAGWEVDDKAAKTFAVTFFTEMTAGQTYGDAVFTARQTTYLQHPGNNTWGAYQAYGDPGYRLGPKADSGQRRETPYVAVEELLDSLEARRVAYPARAENDARPDFAEESEWLRGELARCQPEWPQQADVQQAIGALYADLGDAGFDSARSAYLAALQGEDDSGRVSCRLIEQLANLEARRGVTLAEQGLHKPGKELIDSAIKRFEALDNAVGSGVALVHPERLALLGSALKRLAAAQAKASNASWKAVAASLAKAAAAYFKAGKGGDPAQPYSTLNALPLAWLADTLPGPMSGPPGAELARQCGAEASRRFAAKKGFWDAAGAPDAAVVAWLLDSHSTADDDQKLQTAYQELLRDVRHTAREVDSVAKQLELLAGFLELRARAQDDERAATLKHLANVVRAASTK